MFSCLVSYISFSVVSLPTPNSRIRRDTRFHEIIADIVNKIVFSVQNVLYIINDSVIRNQQ